jgi:hypothetical protein
VIQQISKLWLDADHHVRAISIKAIQKLGEQRVGEVKECFGGGSGVPVNLIENLSGLLSDVHYGEKEMLMDLLGWKFSLVAAK